MTQAADRCETVARVLRDMPRLNEIATADILRATADKLDNYVVPLENEQAVRLMALHMARVCGDPFFIEEAKILIAMLEG